MSVYNSFFKLHDEPFRLTPDPRYLFPSGKHREVLAHLRLGISESGGFVCITGDVGTGKTTLVRAFLEQLEPGTAYAYLFNPPQSPLELLQTINAEFGLPSTATSRKVLVDALNAFLLAQRRAGHRVLVVVDEAQALMPEVLEELRLLSNLETATTKLLQIVLFGQPQLASVLQSADLAQLNQRITLRWHLGLLDAPETAAYVRHRLRVAAGGIDSPIFTRRALALIHRYTGGIPRLINMFCHRCLLAAFGAERRQVTRRTVEKVHGEIQRIPLLGGATLPRWPRRRVAWAAAGAGLAAALGWLVLRPATFPAFAPARPAAPAPGPSENGDHAAGLADESVTKSRESEESGERGRLARMVARGEPTLSTEPPQVGAAAAGTETAAARPASPEAPARALPVPAAAPSADEVTRTLLSRTEAASIVDAVNVSLRRWGEHPLIEAERVVPIDLDAIAAGRDLHHLALSGSMNMIRVLNLPAVLELMFPDADGARYALLGSLAGNTCALELGDRSVRVDRSYLDDHWLGQAHIIWRDFENLAPTLKRGSIGSRVGRLQQMLAEIGFYSGPITNIFGDETEAAVAAFQRSRKLFADALVGQFTRIVLYDALGEYPHPRLVVEEAAAGDEADA
jgi:general secretion pathway protein A